MKVQRSGIGAVIAVVVLIVIVVVAAGAYYALSSSGSKSSTSGTSTSSHTGTSTQSSSSHTSSSSSAASSTSSTKATSTTSTSSSTVASTTSTTSSIATTTSSTATTSTTVQTFSCTTTYSTGTTTDYTSQYIQLIQQFSAIKFQLSEFNGTTTTNATLSYQVISSTGGIYNVTMSLISSSSISVNFVVDSNNSTVLSVSLSGFKETGAIAKEEFDSFMSLFGLQEYYGGELSLFTSSQYFHSTGTTSMTYGTATFPVTTYQANTLPFTVNDCGVNSSITAYTLEVGTPPGTSLNFITYLHLAETSPNTEDVTFQLVSMTVG